MRIGDPACIHTHILHKCETHTTRFREISRGDEIVSSLRRSRHTIRVPTFLGIGKPGTGWYGIVRAYERGFGVRGVTATRRREEKASVQTR